MARVKSNFRKRFNVRYLRWIAARAIIGRVPWLRRRYSFCERVVSAREAADQVLEERAFELPTGFTPAEIEFVRDHCWQYDKFATDWAGGIKAPSFLFTALIRDAQFFGHVTRIFVPSREALVMIHAKRANWNFAKARLLKSQPEIAGRSHFLPFTDNYYHALFDDLVPVVDYLERTHPKGMPLTLVVPQSPLKILEQGCALLAAAYPNVRWMPFANDAIASAPEALWLSFGAGNAEWSFPSAAPVHRLADIFRTHYGIEPGPGKRVFFSRGGSKMRRLVNEDALWAIARELGFERFEARSDNHAEQVRNFSDADIVVGVHGAGLANLAFCKPGTKVIEIFPENFTKSTYLWLSKRLELDYRFLVGGPGDYDQAFTLDEKIFQRELSAALNPTA